MSNDQILFQLELIRAEIRGIRDSKMTGVVDMGLFSVCVLLGLILWRVW